MANEPTRNVQGQYKPQPQRPPQTTWADQKFKDDARTFWGGDSPANADRDQHFVGNDFGHRAWSFQGNFTSETTQAAVGAFERDAAKNPLTAATSKPQQNGPVFVQGTGRRLGDGGRTN